MLFLRVIIDLVVGVIAVYAILTVLNDREKKKKESDGTIEEVSDIAEKMGKSMKRGFLSSLVLIVLNKEPAHGYKLIQEIKERTDERWVPTAASIYPLLKSFTDKGLIRIVKPEEMGEQEKESERPTKTYAITSRGEELIQLLGIKQQDLAKSIMSFMFTSRQDIEDIGQGSGKNLGFLFGGKFQSEKRLNQISEDLDSFRKNVPKEKLLPILNDRKQFMTKVLQILEETLQQIEKETKK